MIQDTSCSPETFDSTFGWGTELNSADAEAPPDRSSTLEPTLAQRDVIWAVNIPGEAEWCVPSKTDALWGQTSEGEL